MRVLAIETATERSSAAILAGDTLLERSREGGKSVADVVLGMVDALLAECGLSLGQMDAVVAGIGPGSFTGVRVGVAVAQGLAFGADLPVVPVSSLESLASRALRERGVHDATVPADRALVCLDARMGEVYWAAFAPHAVRGVSATVAPRVEDPGEVLRRWQDRAPGTWRGLGRGFAAYPTLAALQGLALAADDAQALPEARDSALLGRLRFAAGGGIDAAALEPLYVRDKVALTEAERLAR